MHDALLAAYKHLRRAQHRNTGAALAAVSARRLDATRGGSGGGSGSAADATKKKICGVVSGHAGEEEEERRCVVEGTRGLKSVLSHALNTWAARFSDSA